MIDALGRPQSLLLLGGTSDIALAVARAWSDARPVVTARGPARRSPRRRGRRAARGRASRWRCVDFEAEDTDTHPALIESIAAARDIDVALVAFGVLGDEEQAWTDHAAAVRLAQVNYTGGRSASASCLAEVLRRQGHGTIVALSSVAGERVRRSNFVYGSSKAGMDGFYLGLGEALREHGARVLVVRPGFVHTKMTEGRDAGAAVGDRRPGGRRGRARRSPTRAELVWVPAAAARRDVRAAARAAARSSDAFRSDACPRRLRFLPVGWAVVLAVLLLGPALGPGYVLSYDMVWVPHLGAARRLPRLRDGAAARRPVGRRGRGARRRGARRSCWRRSCCSAPWSSPASAPPGWSAGRPRPGSPR